MGECCGFPRVPASRCARARETTMSRCPARSASPSSAAPVRTGSRAVPVTTIWTAAMGTTSCPADRAMTSGTAGTEPTGSTAATGATIPRAAAGWMSSTAGRATTSSPAAPAMTSCAAAPATTGSTPASAMTSSTAPAGSDTAHLTRGDRHTNVEAVRTVQVTELDSPIRVEGTAAFVERVRADLRLLQASPIGQRMLAELDRGDTIVIVEDESTSASWTALDLPGGRRFTVFTVAYNTMRGVSADRSPPIIGLFHELAHVYDFLNQTGASGVHQDPNDPDWVTGEDGTPAGAANDERAAVGLPIDHDGDPTTPHRIDPDHPYELTENALRDEMAIPPRRRYGR